MKKIIITIVIAAGVSFLSGFIFYKTVESSSDRNTQNNLIKAKTLYDAIPAWRKKVQTEQNIKIGIITDTHVRPNRIDKLNKADNAPRKFKEKYTTPLRNFVAQMIKFQPEFIVHLGDVIEGTGDPDFLGIIGTRMVKEELDKARKPIYWVVGNHDLRSITREQFKNTVDIDSITQSFDVGDYRFIILDANYNAKNLPRTPDGNSYVRGKIPPQEIEWFKKQLETNKRVFVFMHHGIFNTDTPGDLKDDGKPKMKQSIVNAKEIQDILKEYRVDALFHGHIEARKYEKINFTNVYSLPGTKKSKAYPQAYYELEVIDGEPILTMFYAPEDSTEIKRVNFESGEK